MTHQMVPNESDILERQKEKFRTLMERVMRDNAFYRAKYEPLGFSVRRPPRLDELPALPFTLKSELVDDQQRHPPFGRDLTFPLSRYTRIHQTSGTTGRPLRWLDTAESWQWWLDCWREIYRAAGVHPDDRIFVAFSFGPFIGFWTAFEAGQRLGAMVMPGGGLSSRQRLETLLENEATVLVCTPTYALRLAEVARESGIDLAGSTIRITIHAGEPGASVPNVKSRIEAVWGARCVDHAGATEVGAWGYSCGERDHMHINEAEFIAEVIDPETQALVEPDAEGVQRGELVLTNLGRVGSPVIRYRTGDLVELTRRPCPCGRTTAVLRGGVLGRIDHMFIIRGINVFPSALENLIRAFPDIEEFEVSVEHRRAMAELVIRIEVNGQRPADVAAALEQHVHERLNLRPVVRVVDRGSLPRYELKARRFKFSQEQR
ncbi:MAG: phenylacetate--CoA ligase family protein [Acidobacteria bacterium]|nr:MAG: phenylacetate--CoA ligase family protein [Acidobacteriota bacterium]